MTRFEDLPPEDRVALESAAVWSQRFRDDPTVEFSAEFLTWSSQPGNARALKALEASLNVLQDLSASPELLALRGRAIRRARRTNVLMWPPRLVLLRAASALLIFAAVSGVALYHYTNAASVYETDVGVRRMVSLQDGSRVSLDSDTVLRVHFSDTARKIELDRGRARFDVAHDRTRPFTVTAGTQTVVAVGTSFTVEKIGSKVMVTLIQGHVVIKDAAHRPIRAQARAPISLNAGESYAASRDARAVVEPADLHAAMAWEAGQLVFKNVTLEEAVAQENRYTDKPVAVDPSVANLRVSGVFNAGEVVAFVSAVTSYLPVQATTTSDDQILLQKRP